MNDLKKEKNSLIRLKSNTNQNISLQNVSELQKIVQLRINDIEKLIQKQKRTVINKETKEKAFLYYAKGLTAKEIGKLLDISFRTIQNWQVDEKWTDKLSPDNIKLKCVMFKERGLTYKEISHLLKISISTIQRYIKEVSENKKAEKMK